MSIFRSTLSATLLGLTLITGVAATPASAGSWGGHRDGHHYGHDGGRYNRDGWYDNYGHYHRYGQDGHRS